jgi:putative photosynthetic complex assembly protein
MNEHRHDQAVPRGALLGAAALMAFTITVAAVARHSHLAAQASATSSPVPIESFEARFEDRPGGTLAVLDARTGREVTDVAPGTNGFIRGVLRGMFRTRKLESLGHEATFLLARQADGRLTLEDLQTGRRVDLDSFGPTNSAAFAGLLSAGRRQR